MVTGEGLGSLHPCNELVGRWSDSVGGRWEIFLATNWYDSQSKDIQRRCTRTMHRNSADELERTDLTLGEGGGSRTGREY